jgi:non-heme chloroperoxidase
MPRTTVNGAELHYEDEGEGRPVLFIHGVWMSGR